MPKLNNRPVSLNQSGAVSMLSVMIFSLILTVMATAYISSVTSQQRNALKFDQSTRAYYAAESGVQDAVRIVKTNPVNKTDSCQPPAGYGSLGLSGIDYGLGYTCQLIKVDPVVIEGEVQPLGAENAMIEIKLANNPSGPYQLVVRWSEATAEAGATQEERDRNALHPRSPNYDVPLFPNINQWEAGSVDTHKLHALLRVSVIAHNKAHFSRDSIKQRVLFLNPTATPGSVPTLNYASDDISAQQNYLFTNAECYRSDNVTGAGFNGYSCKATINLHNSYNLNNQSIYVRVGSVYRTTKFSLQVLNSSGQAQNFVGGQAELDVTGRADNNIYRRVRQTVSLGGYRLDNMSDAALVAGEGICKQYSLTSEYGSFSDECDDFLTD